MSPPNSRKIKKASFISENNMNDDRVSTDELAKSITEFTSHIPPISEYDIDLVMMNLGLSFISKLRIIRRMKRTIKENRNASHNT